MSNNEKPKWSKIVKLFLEFLIAALVAWFGSSCSLSAKNLSIIIPGVYTER